MVTRAKTSKTLDSIPGVDFVTPEEGKELFDRQARKLLGMSGEEFIRRYRAGEIEDPSSSDVTMLALMIPFAES